jgi:hypothetical protein
VEPRTVLAAALLTRYDRELNAGQTSDDLRTESVRSALRAQAESGITCS